MIVTFHIQKDRRITLGTAIHLDADCQMLKHHSKESLKYLPICELSSALPKCYYCLGRLKKDQK